VHTGSKRAFFTPLEDRASNFATASGHAFSPEIVRQRMQNQLNANAARALYTGVAVSSLFD